MVVDRESESTSLAEVGCPTRRCSRTIATHSVASEHRVICAPLGVELVAGLRLTLYMEDESLDRTPELLLVEAIVEEYQGKLIAHVDPTTWRHERAAPPAD